MTNLCVLISCILMMLFLNIAYEMYMSTAHLRKGALKPHYYYCYPEL